MPLIEQFCQEFLKEHPEEVLPKEKAQELIKKINEQTKTNFSKEEIKKELEKGKFVGKYSLKSILRTRNNRKNVINTNFD